MCQCYENKICVHLLILCCLLKQCLSLEDIMNATCLNNSDLDHDVTRKMKELRILGLLPMSGEGWTGGAACLPAITMALQDINSDPTILAEYTLSYFWEDTKCDPGTALYKMFYALTNGLPYVMLSGGMCSTDSHATSQVSHHWNLTQVSQWSYSLTLSDRKRYPRFFRISAPDQKLNAARIGLLNEFNWKKVATINQALEIFSVVMEDFVKGAQDSGVTVIAQEIFVNDPKAKVQSLKMRDARVIITAMYEEQARAVLCAAYKEGYYGPKIIWIFVGWFSEQFWRVDTVNCTKEEMEIVAEGAFLTGPVFKNPNEERGVANLTASEFDFRMANFKARCEYNKSLQAYEFVLGPCYDHMWVIALALNCTITKLKEMGHVKTLDMFTYSDSDIGNIIFTCMGRTSMTGVTGIIEFESGADPNTLVKVERIQGGEKQTVGFFRQDKSRKNFDWIEGALKWKDDNVPRDSTAVTFVEVFTPLGLYVAISTLGGLGILLTLGLFAFNVKFRKNGTVKLSSPTINNVLLFGCLICYSTVFLKSAESTSAILCKARVLGFALGFTITFSALFSKTWRVYRVFTNKKLLRIAIQDYQLLAVIGILVFIVVSLMIIWQILAPHSTKTVFLEKEVHLNGFDQEVRPYIRMCYSEYSNHFGWTLYLIEGALLTFGAFLAWETRHVKLDALNDSHQIGMCLYNVVILSAVGLTLTLLFEQQVVLQYGISSTFLIFGTAVTQLVIFVPKIRAVKRNANATSISLR